MNIYNDIKKVMIKLEEENVNFKVYCTLCRKELKGNDFKGTPYICEKCENKIMDLAK